MRILKVTQAYYPYLEKGGPATKVRALAERLAARGHQVTVLTSAHAPTGNAHAEHGGNVEVIYLRLLLSYRSLTLNSGLVSFCRRRLRGFEVVHIYGLYDLLGPTVAFFCRKWNVPFVVEPMGMYRPIVRSLGRKRFYHRLFGNALVRNARCLIATSPQEQRELVEEGVPPAKVVVRRNGIELEEFAELPVRGNFRRELNLPNGRPLVLYLGRLSKKKGLDLLLHSFAGLPFPAHLAIVGPDERDGSLEEVRRLRSKLGLEERVTLVGPRFERAKLEAMVDADVFVLPSQNENFGNVVAEAMACGTPVIVTDRCGIAPAVEGRAGIVVPYEERALREGLQRVLQDEPLRQRLRAGCRAAAAGLSWDEPVHQMETIYRQVQEVRAA